MSIEETIRQRYGEVAKSTLSSSDQGVHAVAEAFGYSAADLASIPAAANMGLSCGNPTAMASLRSGEIVVDLGCGGGLDVFLAAKKVGPKGKAIGIDMTPEMIARARNNALATGLSNVEFHQANIDKMPLPDASVDCIISNCVINLAPDKTAVFREIARVLKPGGRLAVSDIALKQPLPPVIENDLMAYVGCIAGAILIDEYQQGLLDAGFDDIQVVYSGADLNAYAKVENQSGCCSPTMNSASTSTDKSSGCCSQALVSSTLPVLGVESCCSAPKEENDLHGGLAGLLTRYNVNEFASSVKVFAVKPKS